MAVKMTLNIKKKKKKKKNSKHHTKDTTDPPSHRTTRVDAVKSSRHRCSRPILNVLAYVRGLEGEMEDWKEELGPTHPQNIG